MLLKYFMNIPWKSNFFKGRNSLYSTTGVCLGQAFWLDDEWAVKYAKKEKNLTSLNIQWPDSYGNGPWLVTEKERCNKE